MNDAKRVLREILGREVRAEWVAWAKEQTAPKPSWLVPWEGLSEPDKEVDRRIGERLFDLGRDGLHGDVSMDALKAPTPPCLFAVHSKGVCHLPNGHREDHWFGAPALSPRQALGEALACLERAATLLQTPGMPSDEQNDGRTATGYTRDAISRARLIRKAAGWS